MARTVAEIYKSIVYEVDNSSFLPGASTSQTALWRMFAGIVAIAIFVHESLWDIFMTNVENFIANKEPGTIPWYHQQTLNFQYGDNLTYINRRFQYAVIDETKKIIKRCAVSEAGGQVRIKVSKLTNGVPGPLSNHELDAYTVYINKVKFAGTNIAIINYDPDLINIELDVYFNGMVLLTSGELISSPGTYPVNDAVENYIANIVYGGVFNINKLIDAVQITSGVEDIMIVDVEAKANNASTWNAVTQNYNFVSGYAIINQLTINYHLSV